MELSHWELFHDTLFPTFRPFLHLEKIAAETCSYPCVNYLNKFFWSISIFFITFLIFEKLYQLLDLTKNKSSKRNFFLIAFCFPIYILFTGFGSIVDVTYPLGVIFFISSFYEITILRNLKTNAENFYSKFFFPILTFLGVVLIDFSRPYGIILIFIFIFLFLLYKAKKHLIAILLALLITSPYHINQYFQIGSPLLTNFSGCYLAEINEPSNYIRPGKMGTGYLRKFKNQKKVHQICEQAKSDIIREYSKKPLVFLNNILKPGRFFKLLFPPTFVPYKEIPSILSFSGFIRWSSSFSSVVMFILIIFEFLKTFIKFKCYLIPKILFALIIFIPFLINLLAHSGNEAIRHSLYLYLPLLYFTVKFRYV